MTLRQIAPKDSLPRWSAAAVEKQQWWDSIFLSEVFWTQPMAILERADLVWLSSPFIFATCARGVGFGNPRSWPSAWISAPRRWPWGSSATGIGSC